MMRQTEQQWKELQQKVKVPDPVIEQNEAERKRKLDLEIKLAVGTIEDRQAGERWMDPKPVSAQKKKSSGIMAKLGAMLWSAILAWWHSPRKQGGAFDSGNYTQTRRPAVKRKRSVNGKAVPIRLAKKKWHDPNDDYEPDFDDSGFNRQFGGNPFGRGPRF